MRVTPPAAKKRANRVSLSGHGAVRLPSVEAASAHAQIKGERFSAGVSLDPNPKPGCCGVWTAYSGTPFSTIRPILNLHAHTREFIAYCVSTRPVTIATRTIPVCNERFDASDIDFASRVAGKPVLW